MRQSTGKRKTSLILSFRSLFESINRSRVITMSIHSREVFNQTQGFNVDFISSYNHSQSSYGEVRSEKQRQLTSHPRGNHTTSWKFIRNNRNKEQETTLKSVSRLTKEHAKKIEHETTTLREEIVSELLKRRMSGGAISETPDSPHVTNVIDELDEKEMVKKLSEIRRLASQNIARTSTTKSGHDSQSDSNRGPSTEQRVPMVQKLIASLITENRENHSMPIYSVLHPLEHTRESRDFPPELLEEEDHGLLKSGFNGFGDDDKRPGTKKDSSSSLQYGRRWYVDSKQWYEMENTKPSKKELEKYKDQEKVKQLAELGSTRMFKEYLLRSKKSVPIWLKDVPVSKDNLQEPQENLIPSALLHRYNV